MLTPTEVETDLGALLAAYPHLTGCAGCAAYLRGLSRDAFTRASTSDPSSVLSFHESSHRCDPRTAGAEHFGF
jgi:hypothetical protein